MTFVTGPLVYPLGRHKRRASLRESAFSLRESTNFYGTSAGRNFGLEFWLGAEIFGMKCYFGSQMYRPLVSLTSIASVNTNKQGHRQV